MTGFITDLTADLITWGGGVLTAVGTAVALIVGGRYVVNLLKGVAR